MNLSQPTPLKIGEVARRTGLTARTLRYYEELGLVVPGERLVSGHRVYTQQDLTRLYRICVLRQLGTPLAEIGAALDRPGADLVDAVDRHLADLDARLVATGRLRERVSAVRETLHADGTAADEEVLELLEGMDGAETGISQRITLLVYDDLEAAHDHLVTVFGLGPGRLTRDAEGRVVHGEVHVGDGVLWLHPTSPEHGLDSPRSLGAATACLAVMVEDVDAHYARAVAAGAEVRAAPRDMDYGYREWDARDPEGGVWSFMSLLEHESEAVDPAVGADSAIGSD